MKKKCTLNDKELIEKVQEWVSRLCKSGGSEWRLHVPVSFNSDPDMLITELCNRFEKLSTPSPTGRTAREIESYKNEKGEEFAFQVPYDGTNKFYNDELLKGFNAGFDEAVKFLEAYKNTPQPNG